MKFILSFLFTFVFISPVMAFTTPECSLHNSDETACRQLGGCKWQDADEYTSSECGLCAQNYTCNNGVQSENQCTNNLGDGKQHPAGASSCDDWVCASGLVQHGDICTNCTNLPDNSTLPVGETDCNAWECLSDFYKEGSGCSACPNNSHSAQGATSVNQCDCNTNGQEIIANPSSASGYESPYFCGVCDNSTHYDNFSCVCDIQNANYNNLTSCSCPENSNNVDGTCVCQDQRVMVNSQGQYECRSCAANAEYVNGACRCKAGYYGDGQTSCAPCPNGSVTVVNGSCGCSEGVTDGVCGDENCPGAAGATEISHCQCKPNYYKVGDTDTFSCSLCPAGTFSDLNSSGIGSCQMNHNTQFCDANGANCMQLIPES